MTTFVDEVIDDPNYIQYLDHGFVGLIDVMGSDSDIAEAARTSYAGNREERTEKQNNGLIRTLMRWRHTSPFEMAEIKFHLKMPIFVMRQHVRHRTANLNEYSGRYSMMSDEFYVPPVSRMAKQSTSNKQMSGEPFSENESIDLRVRLFGVYDTCYDSYEAMLEEGLSRELARIQLPLANYTELYWKIDLHNFLHYVKLRDDPGHAQDEIVALANTMYSMVRDRFPLTCQAWEDYVKNAITFSAQELEVLYLLLDEVFYSPLALDEFFEECGNYNLSKREVGEFKDKLNLIIEKYRD